MPRKPAHPQDAIRSAWRSVGALMLVAVLGFWTWQWQGAPQADLAHALDGDAHRALQRVVVVEAIGLGLAKEIGRASCRERVSSPV